MRALQIVNFADPPKLQKLKIPKVNSGEIGLRIRACGLNFADLLMMKGTYQETPELPFTPGLEVAGTIETLGEGVTGLSVGDRVAVFGGHGGLAEYATYPADRCIALPDTMDFSTAAAFQVAYGTSHLALTYRADIQPKDVLLVLGAAGGVGLTAVEIGKAMGAKVIAVARGAKHCETARAAGADETIDSNTEDLRQRLKDLGGADVVYDPVGGDLGTAAMRSLKRGGRYLVIGFASGDLPEVKLNHAMVKNIAIHGLYWGGYLDLDPAALTQSMSQLFDLHARGVLKPHIGYTAELAQAAEALEKLRRRETTGKVVITMDDHAP